MTIRVFKCRVDHVSKLRPKGIKKIQFIDIGDDEPLPDGWSYTKDGAWSGEPVTKKPGAKKGKSKE